MVRWQRGWPPVRRETYGEMREETAELDRALKAVGGFGLRGTSSSRTGRRSLGISEALGGQTPLEREFRQELSGAFTEDDIWDVYYKYVGRVRHGKGGYGGQSQERAEQIVMRMLRDYFVERGGGQSE